jgi:hypothetical protein
MFHKATYQGVMKHDRGTIAYMREISSRRPLALTDLMSAVALSALALFLISRPVHGSDGLEPNIFASHMTAPERLIRAIAFGGGPLLAIAWYRRKGRTGIAAGMIAGLLIYGGYIVLIEPFLPHYDHDRFPMGFNLVIFSILGAVYGLILGLATWGLGKIIRLMRTWSAASILFSFACRSDDQCPDRHEATAENDLPADLLLQEHRAEQNGEHKGQAVQRDDPGSVPQLQGSVQEQ